MTEIHAELAPALPLAWGDALASAPAYLSAPERALLRHALERLAAHPGAPAPGEVDASLLVRLLAASDFLGRFLGRHPDALAELAELPPVRDRAAWLALLTRAVGDAPDEPSLGLSLRIARQRALVGIVARELVTGDPIATGADLAAFAAAAVEVCLAHHTRWIKAELGAPLLADGATCHPVIIGMGKLGGGELNLSSDIDLIFAYTSDAGGSDGAGGLGREVDLHTYFSRLFARVGRTLSTPTEEGFVFRVDLDLRPEGRTGPICNSAAGLERYYESFGHSWERLAWIKATPIAGDLELGARVISTLAPFVYRKSLDYGFADEVAAMKGRIDARGARLVQKDGFHAGLGRGGIREVEFAVWTLQLAWGGKLPDLRATDTKTALSRLALAGLLLASEADALFSAYRFLRRLEHALQLQDDRQTHLLSAEPALRKRVASLLGFTADDGGLAAFEQALSRHRQAVRAAFDAIVGAPGEKPQDHAWEAAFLLVVDPEASEPARDDALSELGFRDTTATRRRVDALMRRPDSPFHPRALARGGSLARRVIAAVSATPDPDGALAHMETLLRAIRHRRAALDQLEQDPRRLRTLATLFGSSHFLSRLLVRSPGLLDRLVFDGSEARVHTRGEMARRLAQEPRIDGGWEELLGAARRFHQAETLRVGFFDLAGLLDTAAVGQQLSDLADTIITAVGTRAGAHLGLFGAAPLAVVAMGSLAGRELGYGSDLDLLFVHAADADPFAMTRLARRLVTGLCVATPEGTLFEIDARLRPSGSQGPLCVTAERLVSYHHGEAAVWEKQAILRARVVVGDAAVQAVVDGLRQETLGSLADARESAAASVHAMRERLLAATDGPDLKLGVGGLIEVEFLVQLLQLTLSGDSLAAARAGHPAGSPNIGEALTGLGAVGSIDPGRAASVLAAYGYLRRLDNRLFIVQDRPSGGLALLAAGQHEGDRRGPELHRLALRMGYGDTPGRGAGDDLWNDFARHRQTITEAYHEALGRMGAPRERPAS